MIAYDAKNGEKQIAAIIILNFPRLFRAAENGNLKMATKLCKDLTKYSDHDATNLTRGITSSITRITISGLKKVRMKSTPGRDKTHSKGTEVLHLDYEMNSIIFESSALNAMKPR